MKAHVFRHLQVFFDVLGQMARKPVSSILTLSGIGVALALPMLLYILILNFAQLVQGWQQGPRFSLFLETSVSLEQTRIFAERLDSNEKIDHTEVIDRERGLDEMLGRGNLSGLRESLDHNPLPNVIVVYPASGADREAYRALSRQLATEPGVELVQLDLEWIERLEAIGELAIRGVFLFWVLLFFGVALVISNSVRVGVMSAQDEIDVIALIGGTRAFIRRPFLYNGVLHGIGGALIALLILVFVLSALGPAIEDLFRAYGAGFSLNIIPLHLILGTTLASAAIGWLASYVTVTRLLQLKSR